MFDRLGRWIARRPWLFVLIWAAAIGVGATWSWLNPDSGVSDVGSFLPEDSPPNQAAALIERAFPLLFERSSVVVLAYRPAGLTDADRDWLKRSTRAVTEAVKDVPHVDARVLSPFDPLLGPFLERRLVSPDGEVAMILVAMATNFICPPSIEAVEQVERALADPPAGLDVEITGSAGAGRDYARATAQALHKTTWVTIIAVLVILVLVYRSPVGALVPLVSIGASVYLAMVLITVLKRVGIPSSNMERLFAVVLLFGAGVDYAFFWIARYRELLRDGGGLDAATRSATRYTGPAIVASAGTTICGLTTMIACDLVPSRNAGMLLGPVLVVSLLAALTLSPALARLLGRGLFWPMGAGAKATLGQRAIWPRLAALVGRRPGTVLVLGTLVLGLASLAATRAERRFDTLGELPPGSSSARGVDILNAHFARGQLYSSVLLIDATDSPDLIADAETVSRTIAERIASVEGVTEVTSLDAPLGRSRTPEGPIREALIRRIAAGLYRSAHEPVLRIGVTIEAAPFSLEAMDIIANVRAEAERALAEIGGGGPGPRLLMAGLTPYITSVREISGRDQARIMVLTTLVIALIVFVLIRDLPLTVYMLLATWLTYGATLALSALIYEHVLGLGPLDYKVRLIVFVIVVAVGQDYNIFLVTRLFQEPTDISDTEAARRAIVSTGSVISSCGVIMAATLGSLYVGGLTLLQQAGLTLAVGILIDTFFVRPLLIPSFFLATGRRRRSRGLRAVHGAGLGDPARGDSTLPSVDSTVG